MLDGAAIEKVCAEAWPRAMNPDEVHEALLLAGLMTESEIQRTSDKALEWLGSLAADRRAGRLVINGGEPSGSETNSASDLCAPGASAVISLLGPGKPQTREELSAADPQPNRAERLECARPAGAFERGPTPQSGSKLTAL